MGDLQFLIIVLGLGGWPRSRCIKFKWAGSEAKLVFDDMLLSSHSIGWVSDFQIKFHILFSLLCQPQDCGDFGGYWNLEILESIVQIINYLSLNNFDWNHEFVILFWAQLYLQFFPHSLVDSWWYSWNIWDDWKDWYRIWETWGWFSSIYFNMIHHLSILPLAFYVLSITSETV